MTLLWEKISGKDANIGGKVLNQEGTIPKLPLRKTPRADGAFTTPADHGCGWRLIPYQPPTGASRVQLASVPASFVRLAG
jgi:hypothetical protein